MDLLRGSLGSAIKNARVEKKLTHEKLAEIIGITPAHIDLKSVSWIAFYVLPFCESMKL